MISPGDNRKTEGRRLDNELQNREMCAVDGAIPG